MLFGLFKTKSEKELEAKIDGLQKEVQTVKDVAANYDNITVIGTRVLNFDGEKNLGEIGPIISWIPDFYRLASRSWQAYLETPLAKTIAEKWTGWIIDTGLKLKANPARLVLESEGYTMTKEQSEKFNDVVESRWDIWAGSKRSSFTGDDNFAELTKSIYIGSKIGGDQLVILRYVNKTVKIQVIDGQRVKSPLKPMLQNGSIISSGVQISKSGSVEGYWVQMPNELNKFDFISAYSNATGLRTAFLVKGSRWRFDFHRGLPVLTTVLETLKKLERYQEATVASAEEVAKIAYQIVHENYSDGSSPLINQLAQSVGTHTEEPVDLLGQKLADKIASTTNKMAYNNPKGAKIETVNQTNNLTGFEQFYEANANIICAAIGIPPNVATSIYNDSFSASRAATKDWDHSMDVEREFFSAQYYHYIYKFWLYTEILNNKIQAPGYLKAFENDDFMVVESYERARFTGPHFPHIDPVKEVEAQRLMLGDLGDHVNLTTVESATEALGNGDSDSNMAQFSEELKIAEKLDMKPIEKSTPKVQQVKLKE